MKIAIIFDGLGYGGIERVGIDYIKIMKNLGHEVDAYNLNLNYNEMRTELTNICSLKEYKFSPKICPELYTYGVKKWWWGKYAYPIINILLRINLLFKKMIFRIKSDEYDLVIAFAGHINDLTFVANNFLKTNKKMCWLHGSLAEYLLICSGYGDLYRKIKNLCVLSNYADYSALNGNKFLNNLKINKIYNPTYIKGKKLNQQVIDKLNTEYGKFILMVGRFTRQKDQITVVKAMKILKEKYKCNRKLLLVGDGEERNKIEKCVKELNLEDTVVFMGARSDVENFYSAASVFVHSSPSEGLPTVLLEAMTYELPIVATNSLPGVPEILENNTFGLICKVGDEIKMAEQIYELLQDKELYCKFQKKGSERIKSFSPEVITQQLKKILDDLID